MPKTCVGRITRGSTKSIEDVTNELEDALELVSELFGALAELSTSVEILQRQLLKFNQEPPLPLTSEPLTFKSNP